MQVSRGEGMQVPRPQFHEGIPSAHVPGGCRQQARLYSRLLSVQERGGGKIATAVSERMSAARGAYGPSESEGCDTATGNPVKSKLSRIEDRVP